MKYTLHIIRLLAITSLLLAGGSLRAQIGPHDPSDPVDCAEYQWPVHQEPCPEVQIKQKHDHTPLKQYRAQGWDTVVTCSQHSITLSCMPYVPAKFFNGKYTVDTITYFPPDPTFARGTKMPVTTDDDFATELTRIPFPFYFFGIRKTAFVLGANGLITFDTTAVGKYCPWSFSHVLPWPNGTSGAPNAMGCTIANMRDAIYGVYEDTHPIAAYLHGNQGIYYGIQGEYPCRKIICSWNGIPTFPGTRNQNNRCTYQIVCYEGSNIIDVHVKRRSVNTAWQSGRGLIGIQNATGALQVRGEGGSPNMFVQNNAPAAFYPEGANLLTSTLDSFAVRFTPQGEILKDYHWWRVFDDGRPSVELTEDPNDTNGFFTPMGDVLYSCPNLTTAVVTPTETSRYVFQLIFIDASNTVYDLRDTIVIGMDTSHALTLRPASGTPADHQMDICSGLHANLIVEYPPQQDTVHTTRSIERIVGGDTVPLPDSLLVFGELYEDEITTLKRIPAIVQPDSTAANLSPGQIDSILITLSADFTSGGDCPATVTFLLRTFPSYDTTEHYGICRGDTLTWHLDGVDYTNSTTSPKVVLHTTAANCDSVVHLDLKVYDLSYTVDHIFDCKPITWQNGRTYSEDNTATAATDTVVLKNVADCDSIVQLDFTIKPMTPIIEADRDYFDLNHLDVVLNDVSTGGISRTWYFPTGSPQTAATAYYTIPYHLDSATIALVELSPYGCIDTAFLTLPFRKDVVWVPNVFTPGSPSNENNSLFGSISNHLIKEETLIYNRRGELVFRCNEIDCTWDGTDLSGAPCPQGSYVYVIRYITEYDPRTTQTVKGSVTLLR